MQTCLLIEEHHLPIPDSIKELHMFGEGNLAISEDGATSAEIHMGRLLALEGKQKDFFDWLAKVGGMWSTEDPKGSDPEWYFIKATEFNQETSDGEEESNCK